MIMNPLAASLLFLLLLSPAIQQRSSRIENNDWLKGPVQYLITEEERQLYSKLTREEERQQFIEQFWKRRETDPERPGQFQEEVYRRIAYANENFHAGAPGWRTNRGRIYILYGPPNRRDAHPMGGRYEKPPSLGGDTITTYPFEIWEYDYIRGSTWSDTRACWRLRPPGGKRRG
jgi:GWxTD domain-containing protein